MFIGRKKELSQINSLLSKKSGCMMIYGKRKIGNSYLQDTLNACPADSLKVQYDGALSPVLFRSKSEQAEIVQVIVPMRLSAE